MVSTQQRSEQTQRSSLTLDYRQISPLPRSGYCGSCAALRVNVLRQTQTAYNRSKFPEDHRKRLRTANDAFSPKIARPKLASITDHAGSRCFWRRGNLQRDVHAQRPVCRRLLAETSELGGRRCLRVHADQFGPLSLDSLGRPANVPGWHCVSDHDQVYGRQSLWSAQLAASGTNQFSARAACGCSRDYGVSAVPDSVSPNASGASITALGSDCGRAMSFNPYATRLGRSYYLGPCDVRVVVRCRSAAALFALHYFNRDRVHPDCH